MQTKSLLRKGLALIIVVLFVGTSITVLGESSDTTVTKTKATISLHDCSRDQVELRYYDPYTLSHVLGVDAGVVWKSAIRLTQTEMAPYNSWTLTQVVIGFGEDYVEGPINVTIYVYDTGTPSHPGPVIVNDTHAILNGTALITVPLVTPVSLARHTELWVAVEWFQRTYSHFAFIDDGPAVDGKGDWAYLNNIWSELRFGGINANWALGAIVEIQNQTSIALRTIKGPLRITAELQNIGDFDAYNVTWSLTASGGFFHLVNKRSTGTQQILPAKESMLISLPPFIGFGLITIQIHVYATNVGEVSIAKSAFSLGPFVFRFR